jgi:hypothetical protein
MSSSSSWRTPSALTAARSPLRGAPNARISGTAHVNANSNSGKHTKPYARSSLLTGRMRTSRMKSTKKLNNRKRQREAL